MRMNSKQELRGKIVAKFGSQRNFARHIGKTEQTVTAKLNGRMGFSQDDILEWSNALGIKASSIGRYFFDNKVSKS